MIVVRSVVFLLVGIVIAGTWIILCSVGMPYVLMLLIAFIINVVAMFQLANWEIRHNGE